MADGQQCMNTTPDVTSARPARAAVTAHLHNSTEPPSPAPVVVVRAVIVTYEADVALLDSPVAASRTLEEHDGPQDIAAAHGRERFLEVA